MKKPIAITLVALACVALLASIAIVMPKAVQAAIVATLIRDQDNAARHPFSIQCSNLTPNVGFIGCDFSIPSGAEYVIQNVTVQADVTGANSVATFVNTTTGGNGNNIVAQPIPLLVPGQALQTYNIVGRADPGTIVVCELQPTPSSATFANIFCNISGYYVTLP
jgi:hypothetical protein